MDRSTSALIYATIVFYATPGRTSPKQYPAAPATHHARRHLAGNTSLMKPAPSVAHRQRHPQLRSEWGVPKAHFYSWVVYGHGIPAQYTGDSGVVTSASKANLSPPVLVRLRHVHVAIES